MDRPDAIRLIETRSGRQVDPLQLKPDDISLEDVAWSLGNVCRFNGHTSRRYTVAEHSLYVYMLLSTWEESPQVCYQGLCHDISEAYLPDLASPIKADPVFGAHFRNAEDRIMLSASKALHFNWPMYSAVRRADAVLLWCEAAELMSSCGTRWSQYREHGEGIVRDNAKVRSWIRLGVFAHDTAEMFSRLVAAWVGLGRFNAALQIKDREEMLAAVEKAGQL